MKIGFVGIGKMGEPMAANAIKKGYEVYVSPAFGNEKAAANLQVLGARSVPSIAEVIQNADILVTVVNADQNILDVYLGENGVADNLKDGGICVEMSTARGSTVCRVAEELKKRGRDIKLVDAPVSGGVAGAAGGSLTIMAGGDDDTVSHVMPLLEAMGSRIFRTGALGSGKTVKMLNQMLNAGNTAVACEVLFLASQLGVDTDILQEVVNSSSGGSWIFANNVPKFILPENFEGGFTLDLMAKDISIAMGEIEAKRLALPITGQVYGVFKSMQNAGYGDKNYNAIKKWVERNNK